MFKYDERMFQSGCKTLFHNRQLTIHTNRKGSFSQPMDHVHPTVSAADRQRIRRFMRACRSALTPGGRELANLQLNTRLQKLLITLDVLSPIAVYLATDKEASIDSTAQWLQQQCVEVAAPQATGFYTLPPNWEHLGMDNRGVREPSECHDGRIIRAEELRVVLVPGLAFDAGGGRLGQGGGWYDKVLCMATHALKIGVAFDCQLMEGVPQEAHDIRMDWIVTPSHTLNCSRRGEVFSELGKSTG
jgi:5-formyltetrahydrofolate cyclo-ligase